MKIRTLYLYLFSFVGLLIVVIGSVQIIDLGLKIFVFKGADRFESYPAIPTKEDPSAVDYDPKTLDEFQKRESTRQRQRQLSTALAMIFVGTPLYLYHWKTIPKNQELKRLSLQK